MKTLKFETDCIITALRMLAFGRRDKIRLRPGEGLRPGEFDNLVAEINSIPADAEELENLIQRLEKFVNPDLKITTDTF